MFKKSTVPFTGAGGPRNRAPSTPLNPGGSRRSWVKGSALCARIGGTCRRGRQMAVVVSLRAVVEEMDVLNEEWTAYLNRRTGELITVTDEDLRAVESEDQPADLPEWQRELLPKIREVLESDEFLPLPSKDEIHEYSIVERFCEEVEDAGLREELLSAIRGRGAFRRFKDLAQERGVEEAWYLYRQRALEDIAAEWLEANGSTLTREEEPRLYEGA